MAYFNGLLRLSCSWNRCWWFLSPWLDRREYGILEVHRVGFPSVHISIVTLRGREGIPGILYQRHSKQASGIALLINYISYFDDKVFVLFSSSYVSLFSPASFPFCTTIECHLNNK